MMKTITVQYGVFKDGKAMFILNTIKDYPNTPEAIQLLNALVGEMSKAVQMQLMSGHYFAWDYTITKAKGEE